MFSELSSPLPVLKVKKYPVIMPLSLVGRVHESSILVANPIPVKDSTMLGTAEEKGRSNIELGLDLFDAQCCK